MRAKLVALLVVALVMALVFEAVILTASPESLSIMEHIVCGSGESMSIDRVYHTMNSYSLSATCYQGSNAYVTNMPLVIMLAYALIFLPTFIIIWGSFDFVVMMSVTPVMSTEAEPTI